MSKSGLGAESKTGLQTWINTRVASLRTPLPVFPPPPMTTWGRIWRYALAALFGILSFIATLMLYQEQGFKDAHLPLVWVDILLTPVLFTMMALRRKYPMFTILVSSLAAGFSALGSGAITFTLISVATRRQWKELLPAALLWLASSWAMQRVSDDAFNTGVTEMTISSVGAFALMVAVGLFISGRRQAVGALHARIAAAENIRDARFDQARANERSNIAREMHDVLAHRISLVALHSGALSYRTDLSAEQVAETAEIIRDNSHQALKELRAVLGVLRDPATGGDEAPDLPQPGLTNLDALIQDSRLTGARIDVHLAPNLVENFGLLDPTISRNAYRVLQECLTNARKHAPHALVTLEISGDEKTGLFIECVNGLRTFSPHTQDLDMPPSGLGLVGMQERIRASGGTLEFGVSGQHKFTVKAWLPWETR